MFFHKNPSLTQALDLTYQTSKMLYWYEQYGSCQPVAEIAMTIQDLERALSNALAVVAVIRRRIDVYFKDNPQHAPDWYCLPHERGGKSE